ncbi:hypothetical protein EMCRGX_G018235 [Ephydatia muelleri]
MCGKARGNNSSLKLTSLWLKRLELAQGFEAAEKNAQQFKETEVAVHLVAKPKGAYCQSKATYPVFAKLLPRRIQSPPKARKNPVHRKKDETKWVEVEEEDEEPQLEDGWSVGVIQTRAPSQPIRVKVEINGRPMTMEVDTGAAVLLTSEKNGRTFYQELHLKSPL